MQGGTEEGLGFGERITEHVPKLRLVDSYVSVRPDGNSIEPFRIDLI